MIQWAKCFPHKHKVLSSDPDYHVKERHTAHKSIAPAKEAKTGQSWGVSARQSSYNGVLQVKWVTPSWTLNIQREGTEEDTPTHK